MFQIEFDAPISKFVITIRRIQSDNESSYLFVEGESLKSAEAADF